MTQRNFLVISMLLTVSLCSQAVFSEETTVKEGAKEVGHTVGTAVREVGHETHKVTKQVGKTVKDATKTTGHAFRDGAKEFKKAVKGEGEAVAEKSSSSAAPKK